MLEKPNIIYSNSFGVFSGNNDFVLKFITNIPILDEKKEGLITLNINETNVLLTPVIFKKLLINMDSRLKQYESQNGEIIITHKKIEKIKKTKK